MNIPNIESLGDITGKRVLLRLDLNAPVSEGVITDTYRIDKCISTIDLLRLKKAKIIIIAHTESGENTSLLPMWDYLHGFVPVKFCKEIFTKEADQMVSELNDGDVLLFDNIRNNPGEKANDPEFVKKLAKYGDFYINDAFSVSHREHASVVGLPSLLPHCAGPLFLEEVQNLSKAFSPEHPFLFILGGAKFGTKLPLINKFLKSADKIFVGGALATNIFKAKGFEVGTSLVSTDEEIKQFGIADLLLNEKITYPVDVSVKKSDGGVGFVDAQSVLPTDYIGDVGPKTMQILEDKVKKAKFILWNGPMGNYESGFTENTKMLAKIIAENTTDSGTITIVGGGDTLAAIESLGVMDKFSFVSTAGGAMLDFLANETLPGIDALTR